MVVNMAIGFIGILMGGIITWYVAKKYYMRASNDLTQESLKLRVLFNILVNFLADNKLIEIKKDNEGNLVGYIIPVEKDGKLVLRTYIDSQKESIEFNNICIGGKKRNLTIYPPRDKKMTKK